ncbi:DNA polymerase III subunit chi [Methylomarinovum tepidoasis]|uniref:DNA polymerase III subunit chi n=1 Tax=Methylomarinovum tepidoasis TaxID=2840183 RepID=A0AAU9C7M1_9GAMM|nr:DNA polymerase III subunit chi [Methylomarinovum sp. IN45]BCX89269.1 DNA polymerase III subunit chi [Methylomarinovum sp. IN45]
MTRVDFYVLPGADASARRVFACRLAEKAWKAGHKIFIRVNDAAEAGILDELLWTFRQGSFVPHSLAENRDNDPLAAVLIGTGAAPEDFHDFLINLAPDVPEDWAHYRRLAEIVDQDEAVRQAGRQKYRFYQSQGLEPATHKID